MIKRLSKSRILSGIQCSRKLWLEKNKPELAEVKADTERRFKGGHQLNEIVHKLIPNGILLNNDFALSKVLKKTRYHLLHDPDRPLFEAAFSKHNVLIRTDVLEQTADGLKITEVKSSTSVKDYHLSDCAIQTWVLKEAGYQVSQILLAHIYKNFIYPGSQEYEGLLTEEDITKLVEPLFSQVPRWIAQCQVSLSGGEPDIAVGPQCSDPFDCPFLNHCLPPQPDYPIETLPRISRNLVDSLRAEGIHDIRQMPEGLLSNTVQTWVRNVTIAGEPDIRPGLKQTLQLLPFPRYYIDFETIQFTVPIWAGTRPYEQLPFQWSCHTESADGSITHDEFLEVSGIAPMRAFIESLIQVVSDNGPIIVYSGFEKTILKGLAQRFPDLKDPINSIIERLFDLLKLLKVNYYHPNMHGSWSIKSVLPVVVPELSYGDLEEIKDGTSAQTAYEEMISPDIPMERKELLTRSLLDYCKLDTWAMVQLTRAFSS